MNFFRRPKTKSPVTFDPFVGAIRHVVRREAFDHDCSPVHGADCQVIDAVEVVAWTTKDGRQLVAGEEFDAREAAYRGTQ